MNHESADDAPTLGVWVEMFFGSSQYPEIPSTHILDTGAPKYPYRQHFKAEVYPIEVRGPFGGILGSELESDVE